MEAFINRLRKRNRHLGKWARRQGLDAYRIYHRDMPEYPFAVDRYADAVVVQRYLRRGRGSDVPEVENAEIQAQVASCLELDPDLVFIKERRPQRLREGDQYQRLEERQVVRVVKEAGLRFEVNLSDYLDTGLFLDHRNARALVRERAAGKKVLNLFSYTCSFAVHALAGGASEVTNVDLSNTYLDWGQRNLALNDLNASRARFFKDDATACIKEMARRGERYDLIVADPPTVSFSKAMEGNWDVQRDHAWLVTTLAGLLKPGGAILFSTNARTFRIHPALLAEQKVTDITRQTTPEDFAGDFTHFCYWITRP